MAWSLSPREGGLGMGRPCPGLQGAMWSSRASCFTEVEGQMPYEDDQEPVLCMVIDMAYWSRLCSLGPAHYPVVATVNWLLTLDMCDAEDTALSLGTLVAILHC